MKSVIGNWIKMGEPRKIHRQGSSLVVTLPTYIGDIVEEGKMVQLYYDGERIMIVPTEGD